MANIKGIDELEPGTEIKWLKDQTTIVKIRDNKLQKVIFGNDPYICRYMSDQGTQIDLLTLEDFWRRKFDSFGRTWCDGLQNYRMLYVSFRRLYFSFKHMRVNKIAQYDQFGSDKEKLMFYNEITGLNVHGIYFHGKKCLDILAKTKQKYKDEDERFVKKFRGTRNLLLEHNFYPEGKRIVCDPEDFSVLSTSSLMETHIHTENEERVYDVYFDYYEDYYKLESVIAGIIKKF